MRLAPEEVSAIRHGVTRFFGDDAVVRLFGSRARDACRGGDVDLLVEVSGPLPNYIEQSRFIDFVEPALGHKKIDLLFAKQGHEPTAFQRIALRDGIVL